jgi:hypothetical protein
VTRLAEIGPGVLVIRWGKMMIVMPSIPVCILPVAKTTGSGVTEEKKMSINETVLRSLSKFRL